MKKLFLLLAIAGLAIAQDYPLSWATSSTYGYISAASSSCSGAACVWMVLPENTAALSLELSGTFTATVQFEASVGGTNWSSIASTASATSATSTGTHKFLLHGQRYFRVRSSAFTSGPVRVDLSSRGASSTSSADPVWNDDGTTATTDRAASISGTVLKGGGTSLPATCAVGDQYFLKTGTTGNYQCTATNTWTLPGGGGGIDRYWAPQTIGVVPSSPLSLPTANYPSVDAVIGTNIVYGVWSFASGSDQSVYGSLPIPTSVPSSIVFEIRWRTADTTIAHTVSLQALYLCNATGADSSLTSAGTASGNPPSSQYQWTTSTITLSSPSCSAGDTMFFKVVNKGATATATSNIEVASIRIRG